MASRCQACKHPQVDEINRDCLDGVSNHHIAGRYGLTKAVVDNHRSSGHAARAMTAQVLAAGQSGVLAPLAAREIALKAARIDRLADLADRLWFVVQERSKKYAHLTGGASGLVVAKKRVTGSGEDSEVVEDEVFDRDVVECLRGVCKQISEEQGEWRPDGGAKAEATNNLAHAIIVHAKGSLPPPRIEQAEVIEAELEDRDHNM